MAEQQQTVTSQRHADGRHTYELPCCGSRLAVVDHAPDFTCLFCGTNYTQDGDKATPTSGKCGMPLP
jgi:hypothetical protein